MLITVHPVLPSPMKPMQVLTETPYQFYKRDCTNMLPLSGLHGFCLTSMFGLAHLSTVL